MYRFCMGLWANNINNHRRLNTRSKATLPAGTQTCSTSSLPTWTGKRPAIFGRRSSASRRRRSTMGPMRMRIEANTLIGNILLSILGIRHGIYLPARASFLFFFFPLLFSCKALCIQACRIFFFLFVSCQKTHGSGVPFSLLGNWLEFGACTLFEFPRCNGITRSGKLVL